MIEGALVLEGGSLRCQFTAGVLDVLMEQGIVENEKVISGNTMESKYYLSETGLSLLPIVEQMIEWGNNHLTCD